MSFITLASEVATLLNKAIPSRKESAIKELSNLRDLLARALKENEDTLAAQVRKRMKEVRNAFPDIQ